MISEYIAYFENLCRQHKEVFHEGGGTNDPDNPIRRSFIPVTAEDGLEAAVKTHINFPCVVMLDKLYGGFVNKKESYRKDHSQTLWFLTKAEVTDSILLADAKRTAYSTTYAIMDEFISKMLNDYEEFGSCGPFKKIDLANFRYENTDQISDRLFGWKLRFSTEQSATGVTNFNKNKWF